MIAPDLEIGALDPAHLRGWWRLLVPPGLDPRRGVALLFLDGGAPVRLVASRRGAVPLETVTLGQPATGHRAMAELARQLGVAYAVALEASALGRIQRELEGALRLDDPTLVHWVTALDVIRRHHGVDLWVEPRLLDLVPPLAAEPLQRTFDLLWPDGTALVAYCVADGGAALEASLIATKRDGAIDLATTHMAIAGDVDAGHLLREGRHGRVLEVVAERFAPPTLGVFFERAAFHRIAGGPPDQLQRELGRRAVVLDPQPPWLRALLGGAAAAAVATQGARTLARLLPASARRAAADLAGAAQKTLQVSPLSPFALLGFDPIDLWRQLRGYYRTR